MLNNRIVLITGGSSGIGEATALLLARNGADVAITYKSNESGAEKVADQIKKVGRKSLIIQADLINESEAKNAVEKTIKLFGKIDILINNAGRYIEGDEWNSKSDVWVKSLEQNLVSMMNVSKYVIDEFLKQKSGIIVNVASRHGLSGIPDGISYGAAKAGVINITQAYAKLLSPFGRSNSVAPGPVDAGYFKTMASKEEIEETIAKMPNHRLINPNKIAEKILYLVTDESKDINGQNFPVNE